VAQWQNVTVGDIILIKDQEYAPADIILINSSHSSNECFVKTTGLDGECTLKHKVGISNIAQIYKENKLIGKMKLGMPNNNLTYFDGTLLINETPYNLSLEQFICRVRIL
jgi:magnesium-transporting ATPase (P-type)